MAYATITDLNTRFGEDLVITVCDRDLDGAVDTASLTRALDDASSRIDAYVGTTYDVPVSPVPDLLIDLCSDMALYIVSSDAGTATDDRRRRYDDAINMLKDIAKGIVTLGTEDVDVAQTGQPQLTSNTRIFSRTTMDW